MHKHVQAVIRDSKYKIPTKDSLILLTFSRLKSFRILLARFGPNRRSTTASVKPAMSFSPFRTMQVERTAKSWLTMQPRTAFRFRSPARLQVYPDWPFFMRSRTRCRTRTPCFMEKPCLSSPPVIRRT